MKVVFPKQVIKPLYYKIHVQYIINLFQAMGSQVSFTDRNTSVDGSKFLVLVNGREVLFDFCDFACETTHWTGPYFKFHYDETRSYSANIRPFPPVSFYDWNAYNKLSSEIEYTGCGVVAYRQRPYGGAAERRALLGSILHDHCKDMLDTNILPQEEYWRSIQGDFVQLFAPGAREGILDRAQLQCMAFGECTISPKITDTMASERIIPGMHYIMCRDDFSDVPTILNDLERNISMCQIVGNNAKLLFERTCAPYSVKQYLRKELV